MGIKAWAAAAAAAACAVGSSAWSQTYVELTHTVGLKGTIADAGGAYAGRIGQEFTLNISIIGTAAPAWEFGPGFEKLFYALGPYDFYVGGDRLGWKWSPWISATYNAPPTPKFEYSILDEDTWGGAGHNTTIIKFGISPEEYSGAFPSRLATSFSYTGPGLYGNLTWDFYDINTEETDSGFMSFNVNSLKVVSSIPEPSTWAMMLIGFAGLGWVARRRTKVKMAALALAGCAWAGSAGAATRTVTFNGLGLVFGPDTWMEDGVTVSGEDGFLVGPHVDDGYTPTDNTTFLGFRTGARFDAISVDITSFGFRYYVQTDDCVAAGC